MPDAYDGTYGKWLVTGMIDEAVVYAWTAAEAIEKSGIPEWQNPTAAFMGAM